jgi:hypothetical protein
MYFVQVLKQEFKQHFRNVSRIMDCVGCDKCRLWGKVQTTGLGTAMKVLFELDDKNLEYGALFSSRSRYFTHLEQPTIECQSSTAFRGCCLNQHAT